MTGYEDIILVDVVEHMSHYGKASDINVVQGVVFPYLSDDTENGQRAQEPMMPFGAARNEKWQRNSVISRRDWTNLGFGATRRWLRNYTRDLKT